MSLSSYEPEVGIVLESSPKDILVEIGSIQKFETYKNHLQVGKYLRISNGPSEYIIVNI